MATDISGGMGSPWVMPVMTVLSGALDYASKNSASRAMMQAAQRKQAGANFQAAQLEQQAGQQEAVSQVGASEIERQQKYAQSRITALAAFQGGSSTDPTILNLKSRMAADAAYNEAMKMQQGSAVAQGMRGQAAAARYMGEMTMADARDAKGSADMAANMSLLKTGASIYASSPKTLASSGGGATLYDKYNISDTPQLSNTMMS